MYTVIDQVREAFQAQILAAATARAVTCPTNYVCGGKLLDESDSVLLLPVEDDEDQDWAAVSCGQCYDALLDENGVTSKELTERGVEVIDGRAVDPELNAHLRRLAF